jgi:hypothetical protein
MVMLTKVISTTSRLVLDGSLGGEIVSHVILDLDLSILDPSSGFVYKRLFGMYGYWYNSSRNIPTNIH